MMAFMGFPFPVKNNQIIFDKINSRVMIDAAIAAGESQCLQLVSFFQ
jgi:hypothetical protein